MPVAVGCSVLHVRAQPPLPPCVAALSQGPRRSEQGYRAKHPTPGTAGLQAGPGGALTEHSVGAGAESGHGRCRPHLCKRAGVVFQSQATGQLVQDVREGRLPPSPLHASLGAVGAPQLGAPGPLRPRSTSVEKQTGWWLSSAAPGRGYGEGWGQLWEVRLWVCGGSKARTPWAPPLPSACSLVFLWGGRTSFPGPSGSWSYWACPWQGALSPVQEAGPWLLDTDGVPPGCPWGSGRPHVPYRAQSVPSWSGRSECLRLALAQPWWWGLLSLRL